MMRGKFAAALGVPVFVLAFGFPCFAQDPRAAAAPSLKDQLSAQYKPDTVLTVKKAGILSFPANTPDRWTLGQGSISNIPVKYENGQIKVYNKFLAGTVSADARDLAVGEKVNPTKVDVNVKKETVTISIAECDACNGVQYSSFKAQVIFACAKGFLETADPGQVEDLIGQVLEVDAGNNNGDQQQAQAQDNQGQQQTQQAPGGPPQSSDAVQLGQTLDQVVAILGQPVRITNPSGPVKIYQYKDIIIIFTYDKVTKTIALPQPRQAQRPPEPVPPTEPASPPQPPAQVQLGQTADQVVAILGQPDKIANLGSKKIYWYKDMKITFVNDKVTDVQ